jgi:serine/arginine repetitive matrix protein 2
VDRAPITPPTLHSSTAWTKTPLAYKESPARPPDPEHLKAVWSQASDKAMLPAVNSLEGIADDPLPFTLQDVKSEDGETPPPSIPSGPSRMSLHDVTRAFQQVPSSSSSSPSSHRGAPLSPTPTTIPLAHRQPSYTYALPPPGNHNMRQSFAPYSSPMMSAAPGSPMMYPHPMTPSPVPGRMPVNGLYSQSLWMPPPPAQNHNRMIRPLASPYSTPLMSYPTPSTPTIYPPPLPVTVQNPPQQNGSQTRGRNMPVMSPVMSHATTHHMYGASPVLVHAPVVQLPPGHAYMSVPPGRRNDSASGHSPMQQPVPIHSPHSNGYTPVPPASFMRPSW